MTRGTMREAAAEFLGTAVLILFGSGVVAQFVLSGGSAGSYLGINLAWGLAVVMGVYVAGGVSGAHLNPAVTLASACSMNPSRPNHARTGVIKPTATPARVGWIPATYAPAQTTAAGGTYAHGLRTPSSCITRIAASPIPSTRKPAGTIPDA